MDSSHSNAFQGRTPEAVLGELVSVKQLLHGVDNSIEDLLANTGSPAADLPVLQQVANTDVVAAQSSPLPAATGSPASAIEDGSTRTQPTALPMRPSGDQLDDEEPMPGGARDPSCIEDAHNALQLSLDEIDIAELAKLLDPAEDLDPTAANAKSEVEVEVSSRSGQLEVTSAQSSRSADVEGIVDEVIEQLLPQLKITLSQRLTAALHNALADDQALPDCQ